MRSRVRNRLGRHDAPKHQTDACFTHQPMVDADRRRINDRSIRDELRCKVRSADPIPGYR